MDVRFARAPRAMNPDRFPRGLYAYDLVIDIGAYRDLHRHRRCQKFPALLREPGPRYAQAGGGVRGRGTLTIPPCAALSRHDAAPRAAAHYLLPFGARSRFLFKMDFRRAEYIARLRSGGQGSFQLPRNPLER